jgi:hypothetical protein
VSYPVLGAEDDVVVQTQMGGWHMSH